MNAYDIIKKPILSEKCYKTIQTKKYGFLVDNRADKVQIKAAVEEIFKVKVKTVRTVKVKGKLKKQGRSEGYTPVGKKAYVQLTADSKPIAFFESLS